MENILIIDNYRDPDIELFLKNESYNIYWVETIEQAINLIKNTSIEAIICDLGILEEKEKRYTNKLYSYNIAIIVTISSLNIDKAIDALNNGAYTYLKKPIDSEELKIVLRKAIEFSKLHKENALLKKSLNQKCSYEIDSIIKEHTNILENTNLKLILKSRKLELMHEELKKTNLAIIKALSKAIEAKDSYTIGHCSRVQEYSMLIGKALKLSKLDLERLEYAAYIHDIGKIGISEATLLKPSKLTPKEYEEIKLHPIIGESILKDIDYFKPILPFIRYHHENWDGTGYPDNLVGENIPLLARILKVADVFDALTSNRAYRLRISPQDAIDYLIEKKSKEFDPKIVEIFVKNYNPNNFKF